MVSPPSGAFPPSPRATDDDDATVLSSASEIAILNNDSVPDRPERNATLRALADLPEVERRALVLAYYAAMPCDRIAEATSSTPPSVLSRLHDATRLLLEGIATHGRN